MSPGGFYDDIAELYHLVYADWEGSVAHQGEVLHALIGEALAEGPRSVLDVSCGIGTQALALAAKGHTVTALSALAGVGLAG